MSFLLIFSKAQAANSITNLSDDRNNAKSAAGCRSPREAINAAN